jgi:hypothetical protein
MKKSYISDINKNTNFIIKCTKQDIKIETLREPKIGKHRRNNLHPHLVAEGAETLHAAGREVALVTFNTTPN